MNDDNGFRLRLKVRIGKKLNTEQKCLAVEFGNRQVTIRSEKDNQALQETTWIFLEACGFATEDEAHDFGAKLRDAVSVGALCSRLGADPGQDELHSWLNEELLKSEGVLSTQSRLVPDRHGLVVMPDDGNNVFLRISRPEVTVRSDPAQFTGALTALAAPLPMDEVRISVRLLNLAMLNSDPIARIILAVSAVESLVVARRWGADKRKYINDLANRIDNEFPGDSGFQQIATAIRNISPLSVGKGIEQVLNDEALKNKWDSFYGRRSRLVHGPKPLDQQELGQLASDAIHLCTKILLITLKRTGASLPEIATTHFGSL